MQTISDSFNSIPTELVKEIFLQTIADDEARYRQHPNTEMSALYLMGALWYGNEHPLVPMFHPNLFYGLRAREWLQWLLRDVRRRMTAFAGVCKLWRAVVSAFRGQLLSVGVSSHQHLSFNTNGKLSAVTHLELASTGPDELAFAQVKGLPQIVELLSASLSCFSFDRLSIRWMEEILALLPRRHSQLQTLRVFLHDEGVPEADEWPTSLFGTIKQCDGLRRAEIERHNVSPALETMLFTMLTLPHLHELTLINKAFPAFIPVWASDHDISIGAASIHYLRLVDTGHTFIDSLAIAARSAPILRRLQICSYILRSGPDSASFVRGATWYPKLEHVALSARSSHQPQDVGIRETEAMLDLLEKAPLLTRIELSYFSFVPSATVNPRQPQSATDRLIAKVGNGVVQKLFVKSMEDRVRLLPDDFRALLERDRPQSWRDNGVEVFLDLDHGKSERQTS